MAKINGKIINPFCAGCRDGATEICCINSAEWSDFVRSYLSATKVLAQGLKKETNIYLFHPLAFMIRHSIELLLKNELLSKCEKPFDEMRKDHDLELLINDLGCETKLFDYVSKEEMLNFHKHDKSSFEFRYPVNKKNTSTCNGLCCFGINESIELCNNMLEFLDQEYPYGIDK